MCHKDFKIRDLFYKKDTKNFMVQNKSDYFKISSYTTFIDQMLLYAGLRKGQGEQRSYKLNYVALHELGDEKLDYSEEADIKTLPYVNYKKFVMYNIKDVLLQLGIERKTHDIDNMYLRAYSNATSYHKIFKQTVFLKNRAYLEFYKQGLIIANNINVEYGITQDVKDKDKKNKFDGALVADPMLNSNTGIELLGILSMFIFDNVVDMDFSSMYPHIIIAFNIAPNCMIGKLIISKSIQQVYTDTISDLTTEIDNEDESDEKETYTKNQDEKYDAGKDFVDNMLINNPGNMGAKWFGLPSIEEMNELIKARFLVNNKKRIVVSKDQFDKYYLEELLIDIGEVI